MSPSESTTRYWLAQMRGVQMANGILRCALTSDRQGLWRWVCHPSKRGPVCPSICPSDWDKRKTLVASGCVTTACDERLEVKRRGQDSNLRTSFPVTDLANPRYRPLSHLSEL